MPRVSDAHRDRRRREILDAARTCFAREGFQATSMQHVLAESGLSAGAVYGYFASKEEIVVGVAVEAIESVLAAAPDPAAEGAPLADVLDALLAEAGALSAEPELSRLVVQAWAESLRSPAVGAALRERVLRLRAVLAGALREERRRGRLDAAVDPEAGAQALAALLPGMLLQAVVMGDVDPAAFRTAARGLLSVAD